MSKSISKPQHLEPRATVMLVRCAVYTRKSTEEGFNSIDAQLEAGEAYVRSESARGGH